MWKKINYIIFCFIVSVTVFTSYINIKADSGWDTSYGGGGYSSSDWGSSYDSGYSSSDWDINDYRPSRSYNSGGQAVVYDGPERIFLILIPIFIWSIPIFFIIHSLLFYKRDLQKAQEQKERMEKLNKDLLKNEVCSLFAKLQDAITNFDYEILNSILTENLIADYKNYLNKLKKKKQQNITKDFSLITFDIAGCNEKSDYILFNFKASMIDYIINSENGVVVKGTKDKKILNTYICRVKIEENKYLLDKLNLKNTYLINSSQIKNNEQFSNEEFKKVFPNKNIDEFESEAYNKFIDVQNAWMNFDYDSLRKLCSDELYNTYYEELEALKLKGGKNIMSNFELIEDRISSVREENDLIYVDYYLDVKFFDYVINEKDNKIINGNDKYRVHNIYILTYVISKNKQIDTCPNCGAKLEDQASNKCKYCDAVIIKDTNSFILNKKRKIN